MILLPIRFIGAEVRRPEGVTLRRVVAERHPDTRPGLRMFEEGRVRIGSDARRLANGEGHAQAAPHATPSADEESRETPLAMPPGHGREVEPARERAFTAITSFRWRDTAERSQLGRTPYDAVAEQAPYALVPYEALRRAVLGGWTLNGETTARPSSANESGERGVPTADSVLPLDSVDDRVLARADAGLHSARSADVESRRSLPSESEQRDSVPYESVPYDVLRRVVTDATADGVEPSTRELIFTPPENGGEPYGREVPFEDEEPAPADVLNVGTHTDA